MMRLLDNSGHLIGKAQGIPEEVMGHGVRRISSGLQTRRCARLAQALILIASLVAAGSAAAALDKQQPSRSTNPHGQLKMACENCHTSTSWTPLRPHPDFDHSKTGYPLRGMHAGIGCRECHVSLVFSNVGTQCADCHADIHRRQMSSDCQQCHSVLGWQVSLKSVNMHQNRFPLMGAHGAVECEESSPRFRDRYAPHRHWPVRPRQQLAPNDGPRGA